MRKVAGSQQQEAVLQECSYSNRGFISYLSRTLAAANGYLMLLIKKEGLNSLVPSHGDILVALFDSEPIAMNDLAAIINRDPSTVTALVKKLVSAGYVETDKNPSDRRVTEVSLTPKGKSLRKAFDDISDKLTEVMMDGIDAEAYSITCETLGIIKRNFDTAARLDVADIQGEQK